MAAGVRPQHCCADCDAESTALSGIPELAACTGRLAARAESERLQVWRLYTDFREWPLLRGRTRAGRIPMMAAESIWEWTRKHPWRAAIGVLAFAFLLFA